jgi:hypothetical protein
MLARVHNEKGTGTVLSLHTNLVSALAETPRDRDGCPDHRTCYWQVPHSTKVGHTVALSDVN